jgi:hypothetical protein
VLNRTAEALVDKKIAIMIPIGQIIDDQKLATSGPCQALPTRVHAIMIHNQPVNRARV